MSAFLKTSLIVLGVLCILLVLTGLRFVNIDFLPASLNHVITTEQSPDNFYISPNGNDANDGSLQKPFKTLEKARDKIREIKQSGQFTNPINIYLRAGSYKLDKTFKLLTIDSGKAGKEISYMAYPGETVNISGGEKLSLSWQLYKNGIYFADVSSFVNKYGPFNTLEVNSELATRARTPNEGMYSKVVNSQIPDIVLEAENATLSNYIIETIDGKKYAIVPEGTPDKTSFDLNAPSMEFSFEVVEEGYYVFGANNYNDTDAKGTIFIQIDGQENPDICSAVAKEGNATWQWRNCIVKPADNQTSGDYSLRFFSKGTHNLKVFHGTKRVKYDAFRVTQKFSAFGFSENDINPAWKNLNDVEIVSFQSFHQSRSKIKNVVNSQVYLKQSAPWVFSVSPDPRYFVENMLEGINSTGEWYLDKTSLKLYYQPSPSENISKLIFTVPHLNQLLKIDGVSYLNFKYLSFVDSDWQFSEGGDSTANQTNGITIKSSNNLSFVGNIVRKIGGNGLDISDSTNIDISRNKINNIGGAGINSDNTTNLNIKNNIIKNIGIKFKASPCIMTKGSNNLQISKNEIFSCPFNGIQVTSVLSKAIISENLIYQAMTQMNDGAGIYTNRVATESNPAVEISNNIIHDILPTSHQKNYLSFLIMRGIYLDSMSKNYLIKNNLVYKTHENLKMNSGSGNIVENNIFVDGGNGQIQINNVNDDKTNTFRKNIVYYSNSSNVFEVPEENKAINHGFSICDGNLYFNPTNLTDATLYKTKINNVVYDFNKWRSDFGLDKTSIITNPLFVDYTKNDFRLKSNSPTFALGFQSFDLANVGTEKAYFRSFGGPACKDKTNNNCVNNGDNAEDKTFCQNDSDCVYKGICYSKGTHIDLNGDNKIDGRCMGDDKYKTLWRDCDSASNICSTGCKAKWLVSGEIASFGEYNSGTAIECCGDDANEYPITTNGKTACCNKSTDKVDALGKCSE